MVITASEARKNLITVIATRSARAGATAWKGSEADLREYEGQGLT